MEPPISDPKSKLVSPAAVAAAPPPAEPPEVRDTIPWVVRPAEHRIAGLHVCVAGRHVGLADDDGPRATQTGDGLSVLRRHIIGQVGSTADRAHTSRLVAVLHGDRQAVQGSEVISARACGIGLCRRAPRSVRVDGDDRVQRWVMRADARQIQLDQFGAGHVLGV